MPRIGRSWLWVIVGLGAALVAAATVAGGWLEGRSGPPPDVYANVGGVDDFPSGSMTEFVLDVQFFDPTDTPVNAAAQEGRRVHRLRKGVPVWVVHHPAEGLLAFYDRDPHLGCRVVPTDGAGVNLPAEAVLFNPCHFGSYTLAGECVDACPRGLDRFGVRVIDGDVVVDVSDFQAGVPAG